MSHDIKDKELHRIAITAIIYREVGGEKKYLVTQRSLSKKAFPGKWTVPGGGLTIDDYIDTPPFNKDGQWIYSVEKALHREVLEEVNLIMGQPEYLLNVTFIRPDNVPVLILSYFGQYISGEVKMDEDTIAYKWIGVEEARGIDLIDGIAMQIEKVDAILSKRETSVQ
ncbi:MAG: NUDIX domain-containing protein [bacterium]|nr:NUDIX domain-containing protein [bacterium]